VIETPDEVKAQWETLGFSTEEFLGGVGLSEPAGEQGRSPLEMIWARPTCEFNGITGGYTGEGFKTVLPAEASAKISCRLVGDQDPEAIRTNLRAYIESCLPPDCTAEYHPHGGSGGISLSADNPVIQKAKSALTDEWNEEAAVIGMGGSIPVIRRTKSTTSRAFSAVPAVGRESSLPYQFESLICRHTSPLAIVGCRSYIHNESIQLQ